MRSERSVDCWGLPEVLSPELWELAPAAMREVGDLVTY